MAITKQKQLKEIVIRYDDDENLELVDKTYINVYKDGDEIVAIKSLRPEIITEADVDGLMDSTKVSLANQVKGLKAERDQAVLDHTEIVSEKETLEATIETLEAEKAELAAALEEEKAKAAASLNETEE